MNGNINKSHINEVIPRSYTHDNLSEAQKMLTINLPTNLFFQPKQIKISGLVGVAENSSQHPQLVLYFNEKRKY